MRHLSDIYILQLSPLLGRMSPDSLLVSTGWYLSGCAAEASRGSYGYVLCNLTLYDFTSYDFGAKLQGSSAAAVSQHHIRIATSRNSVDLVTK
jgi:hypothetical protein